MYTAADELFVLTGTKANPPRLMDAGQGMVTGASVRFHSGDDSVVVESGPGAERVRSQTRP